MNVLICGPKASNISGISVAIFPRCIRKNPPSIYAHCTAHDGAICPKNRKIVPYHTGTAPILEMERAYGLRPRLWLFTKLIT